MKFRDEKIVSAITQLSAEFIRRVAGPSSLITVTGVHFEDRANRAKIMISVLPDSAQDKALAFLTRQRGELAEHIRNNIRMRSVPLLSFAIDVGEKNRQRIDELENNSAKHSHETK